MRLLAKRAALSEDAATLLAELGASAAEVAASLRSVGIGSVAARSVSDCPFSRFIHAVVASDPRVEGIRLTNRWLVLETRLPYGSRIWVRLPRPVRDYVWSAQGAWPDEGTVSRHDHDNLG